LQRRSTPLTKYAQSITAQFWKDESGRLSQPLMGVNLTDEAAIVLRRLRHPDLCPTRDEQL
jgi:hypothetical protein